MAFTRGHEATDTQLPNAPASQATGHSPSTSRCTAALPNLSQLGRGGGDTPVAAPGCPPPLRGRPHVTGDRSPLMNALLHCSTSKPVLNVALSSPAGYPMFCTPPPPLAQASLKVSKTTVTRAHVLRQGRACARRAVPKERMSPETCPYLTLSTIVATGHYNTMCRQISASSGGPHCPSGPSGAVE